MCQKSITELSDKYREKARDVESAISRRLSEVTQTKICEVTGADKNKVSRLVSNDLDLIAGMLAVLGLKLVPQEYIYCDPAMVDATGVFLQRAHSSPDFMRQLFSGGQI